MNHIVRDRSQWTKYVPLLNDRRMLYLIVRLLVLFIWHFDLIKCLSKSPYINTTSGEFFGQQIIVRNVFVHRFYGIPYAEQPQRFELPVMRSYNSTSTYATQITSGCLQAPGGLNYGPFDLSDLYGEDCLTLNIFIPHDERAIKKKKAIMVFCHGGSNQVGSASLFDGSVIAALGDVIVISINYRLNIFGFLSPDKHIMKGNYGLQDQLLALKWISINAELFNGDNQLITYVGHSAGAANVALMAMSKKSKGLIRRVISQSGCPLNLWAIDHNPSIRFNNAAKRNGFKIKNDVASKRAIVQGLKNLSSNEFRYMYHSGLEISPEYPFPIIDDDILESNLEQMIHDEPFRSVDMLIGVTADEALYFAEEHIFHHYLPRQYRSTPTPTSYSTITTSTSVTAMKGQMDNEVQPRGFMYFTKNKYIRKYLQTNYPHHLCFYEEIERRYMPKTKSNLSEISHLYTSLVSDLMFYYDLIRFLHERLKSKTQAKTYAYYYTYPPIFDLENVLRGPDLVGHFAELDLTWGVPFYGKYNITNPAYNMNLSYTKEQFDLSEQMILYWTNFVKTGDPNNPNDIQVHWPPYEQTKKSFINLHASNIRTENHYLEERFLFWDTILNHRTCSHFQWYHTTLLNDIDRGNRTDSTRIMSYRTAVNKNHITPLHKRKQKRIGNDIDLSMVDADLIYVSSEVLDEHQITIEELIVRFDTDLKTGLTHIQAKQRLKDEGRNYIEPPHVSVSTSCQRFWLQPYVLFISILSLLAILCFVAFAIQLNTRQDTTFENLYMLVVLVIFILLPSIFTFAVGHISANKLQHLRYQIKQSKCEPSDQWEWTQWFNIHHPTQKGEYEMYTAIRSRYPQLVCANPKAISAINQMGVDMNNTLDVIVIRNYDIFCLNNYDTKYQRKLCDDYSVRYCCPQKSIVEKSSYFLDILPHQTNSVRPLPSYNNKQPICGKVPIIPQASNNFLMTLYNSIMSKIINGVESKPNTWPWLVSIGIRYRTNNGLWQNRTHICGGTLIEQSHVLTAAHCLEQKLDDRFVPFTTANPTLESFFVIRIGIHDIRLTRSDEMYTAKKVWIHENFVSSTFENDIGIIRLNQPVPLNHHTSPICLPTSTTSRNLEAGSSVSIAGWGTISESSRVHSNVLRQADVNLLAPRLCRVYTDVNFDEQKQLCAAALDWSKDTCAGDSGGPLMFQENGTWNIGGITSYGFGCAKRNFPGQVDVKREGALERIHSENLVRGDIIHVRGGDRVAADIRIVHSSGLLVDNSIITKDADPASKSADFTSENPLETNNLILCGTSVIYGTAIGIVVKTAEHTLLGKMSNITESLDPKRTIYARTIRAIFLALTVLGLALGLIFFIVLYATGYYWLYAVQIMISVYLACIPEILPAIAQLCLTRTAQHMATRNCLVKVIDALYDLACTTILFIDKSVLTTNKMATSQIWIPSNQERIISAAPTDDSTVIEEFRSMPGWQNIMRAAVLCCRAEYFTDQHNTSRQVSFGEWDGDAREIALLKYAEYAELDILEIKRLYPRQRISHFTPETKRIESYHFINETNLMVNLDCMMGAPERVFGRCATVYVNDDEIPKDANMERLFNEACIQMGSLGDTVLGFADRQYNRGDENQETWRFLGLISLSDPIQENVITAIEKCRLAGVKVILITGDHPVTACALAKRLKIFSPNSETVEDIAMRRGVPLERVAAREADAIIIHGRDIQAISQLELADTIINAPEVAFARTTLRQKQKIVECAQLGSAVVTCFCQSADDRGAIRKADVSVAMLKGSSESSRQEADLVLLDNDLNTLVAAIEEVPFLMFLILQIPLTLGPITLLIIDLITELLPTISLAYEKPESDIMTRGPIDKFRDLLINRRLLSLVWGQIGMLQVSAGFFTYLVVMAENGFWPSRLLGIRKAWDAAAINDLEDSYGQEWTYRQRKLLEYVGYASFLAAIIIVQIANLLVCKTRRLSLFQQGIRSNVFVIFCIIFMPTVAVALIYIPGLNRALFLERLQPLWWLPPIPFAIMIFIYDEIRKLMIRKHPEGWVAQETYH
ncbi:unnamed protein product [Didymodactylos carnosus]|uniref:Peptidase S1 domain-containing protein n=1 Tax=Didymodactylos carnosus TaxID=1234261 RepID=A0A813NCC8_9BILA|nr:unnamed protein product [Didymodactylos carnosus]CAF3515200.1 unnamed protein product [Didymodactylos carnosus]